MLNSFKATGVKSIYCAAISAFVLSGCAVFTPTVSSDAAAQVKTVLVGAEYQNPHFIFESRNPIYDRLSVADASLNTSFLQTRVALAAAHTQEDAKGRFAPSLPFGSKVLGTSTATPAFAAPIDAAQSEEAAFVKVNGSVDARDWDECARQTGGVFDENQTGFKLLPQFSDCMRGLGYKPEAEMLREMEQDLQVSAPPELRSFATDMSDASDVSDVTSEMDWMQDEVMAGGL